MGEKGQTSLDASALAATGGSTGVGGPSPAQDSTLGPTQGPGGLFGKFFEAGGSPSAEQQLAQKKAQQAAEIIGAAMGKGGDKPVPGGGTPEDAKQVSGGTSQPPGGADASPGGSAPAASGEKGQAITGGREGAFSQGPAAVSAIPGNQQGITNPLPPKIK